MLKRVEEIKGKFLRDIENKPVEIISHHDTDGITSAAILAKTIERLDKPFSVKIVKQFEPSILSEIKSSNVTIFLDLASSYLNELNKLENIYIIDHHEIPGDIPDKINFINPHEFDEEEISAAGLTYLFSKSIDEKNKDLANLAVIGMIGDMLDKNISKLNNKVLNDAEILIKKGLLFYPATRPINKTLEFSSSFYIPGVTGNSKGAIELLREAGIEKENGEYKSLIELTDQEMSRLITSIMIRTIGKNPEELIGNLYLVKFFSKLQDARELSATLNACSRLGYSDTALLFCLGSKKAAKRAEEIYLEYKQHLISALNLVTRIDKIEGKDYVIINAQEKIKDTIIGTVASILSNSPVYGEGTIITTMAYSEEKIKVSTRVAGRAGRNVREILEPIIKDIGGECGGHALAAGCLINKEREQDFLNRLKDKLEIQIVKV
jgi:RecJ-like exonuclease